MSLVRTRNVVFLFGAALAVAAPLGVAQAQGFRAPQPDQQQQGEQEEERKRRDQRREDRGGGGGGREQNGGQQNGREEQRRGGREEQERRGGGGEERRRGEERREFGQPGGPGQQPGGRPGQRDEDDRGRGEERRREFGQPGGPGQQPGGRPGQRDEDDRGRGEERRREFGQPGGPGQQPSGRPGQRDEDDRGRGGDERRREFGGPGGPGGPGGKPDFEAIRPATSPEDRNRFREQRREFSRERLQDVVKQRRQRQENGRTIIEEPDARFIVRGEGGRAIIRHDESARFKQRGADFREERGPGGIKRSIVIRRNGMKVVSEVDEQNRLITRYREGPGGRRFVLIDNRDRGEHDGRRGRPRRGERRGGPGFGFFIDLPAPVIRIPRERYYVYADRASERDIEDALSSEPVEEIESDYTLDEIRYSPRLRERMPSVNLNTINFEFGSWEIAEEQIGRLSVVAKALERILRRNPDEVFLIEGHTDAVGSDEDNLSLSDRRAEAVARVLSDEFGIPPENLVTQGYGEQYLLVDTTQEERANRRVEFRRITPLLARGEER